MLREKYVSIYIKLLKFFYLHICLKVNVNTLCSWQEQIWTERSEHGVTIDGAFIGDLTFSPLFSLSFVFPISLSFSTFSFFLNFQFLSLCPSFWVCHFITWLFTFFGTLVFFLLFVPIVTVCFSMLPIIRISLLSSLSLIPFVSLKFPLFNPF